MITILYHGPGPCTCGGVSPHTFVAYMNTTFDEVGVISYCRSRDACVTMAMDGTELPDYLRAKFDEAWNETRAELRKKYKKEEG